MNLMLTPKSRFVKKFAENVRMCFCKCTNITISRTKRHLWPACLLRYGRRRSGGPCSVPAHPPRAADAAPRCPPPGRLVMVHDDLRFCIKADAPQLFSAKLCMMACDVESMADGVMVLHPPLRELRRVMAHEYGHDLAHDVEVALGAADVVQQGTAHEKFLLLTREILRARHVECRVGDVARMDMVGRMVTRYSSLKKLLNRCSSYPAKTSLQP